MFSGRAYVLAWENKFVIGFELCWNLGSYGTCAESTTPRELERPPPWPWSRLECWKIPDSTPWSFGSCRGFCAEELRQVVINIYIEQSVFGFSPHGLLFPKGWKFELVLQDRFPEPARLALYHHARILLRHPISLPSLPLSSCARATPPPTQILGPVAPTHPNRPPLPMTRPRIIPYTTSLTLYRIAPMSNRSPMPCLGYATHGTPLYVHMGKPMSSH